MTERPGDQQPAEASSADEAAAEEMPFRVRAFDDAGDDGPAPAERRLRPLERAAQASAQASALAAIDAELDGADADDEPRDGPTPVDASLAADADDDLADAAFDDEPDPEDFADTDAGDRAAAPGATGERAEMLKRAKESGGMGGAVLMGALLGIKDVLEKPREQPAIMMEVAGTPHDIDTDGLEMDIDDERRASVDPLPVMNHLSSKRKRRFGRRR